MKKFLIIFAFLFIVSSAFLFAQETEAPVFEPSILAAILTAGGLGVLGFTEMFKRLLRGMGIKGKWVGYVLSVLIGAVCTWLILNQMDKFTWMNEAIYTVIVWLEVNGIYKFPKPKPPEPPY